MTFKSQLTTDMSVFLNTDEFAETITYNGSPIDAIVDYGEDLDDVKNGTNSIADTIQVMVSDVATPAYRDAVIIGGNTYAVLRRKSGDGYTWTLEIYRGERPGI